MDTASNNTPPLNRGLFESFKTLLGTLLAITHTRVDLMLTDFEEDRLRLMSILSQALVGFFCLALGVLLSAIFLVVAFWDTHRLLMLGSLAGFFVVIGLAILTIVHNQSKAKPKLFAVSLSELLKDWEQLEQRS